MTARSQLPTNGANGPVWQKDLLASIVVFLVALPLCMGIALASGLPPERAAAAGILTGIIGGVVVGILGGCPLQVSGPAAGLIVIVWQFIQEHGIESLGAVVFGAGCLQLAAGLGRLGRWFRAVSPAVIQGMLAGIGVLIFAGQFHFMVDDQAKGSGLANLLSLPEAIAKGLFPLNGHTQHHFAARVGVLTITVMVLWKSLALKRLHFLPAPLIAVGAAVGVDTVFDLPIISVALPDNLLNSIRWLEPADLHQLLDVSVLATCLAVALVASAETLLCAAAVDQMHTGPRTHYDRELAGQGIGNMLCGLLGAVPMTGVIVRSGANVEAGARTRWSAVLHGLWLLLFVSLVPHILELIPRSCLAAILVYTGYKLVNVQAIKHLWATSKSEVVVYAGTVVAIVGTDLLTGVLVGVGLSTIKLLINFCRLSLRLRNEADGTRWVLDLVGTATFFQLPRLAALLETVNPQAEVCIHHEQLTYIDHACLCFLENWHKQHVAFGGKVAADWDGLTAKFTGHRRASALLPFAGNRSRRAA